MSYISKLLCMWTFTLYLRSDDAIVFIQNSTTWNEAFTKCSEQNSKLAVISDVERNRSCDSTSLVHREKQFWIGNFYKLSGRISVKGCYNISNSTMEGGYKTLYQCFVLCSRGMKEVGLFAYKAVFESNCICDHHLHLNHSKDFQMVEAHQCSNISLFWWVYTVIQNDFNSVHETCHQFTCTDSQVKYNTLRNSLCEKNSQKDYHDLRSEIPRENVPYGCERNAENNNSIVFPDYFRFALNSSVNTGHIRINQTKVSWTEAVVQCNITGSRIASETDIHQDKQLCKTDILQNQTFGLGTTTDCPILLKLKVAFLVVSLDSASTFGHGSLHDCYQQCSMSLDTLVFAHKRLTDRANCICNFKGVTTNALVEIKQLSTCLNQTRSLWWKYTIHKSELQTNKETCQQISCTHGNSADKIFRDKLCGPRENDNTQDVDLLRVCSTNSNNNITTNIGFPWRISFMYNASIETDLDQIESKVANCKGIACVNGNRYETLRMNCSSETLGFICLNEIGTALHVNNTQLTTSGSSVKVPIFSTEQPAKNSSNTNTRKMSTEASTSKEKKTSVSSGPKLEHDASTSTYIYTKYQEKITKFATIPGAPDIKSPMTYISSDLHSHVTKSSKENIVHSTSHEVLNENVNDNSPIGLLVGIIVTALVLVAVIVLLVVCRFKRKGLFRNKLYGDDSRITMFNSPNYKETDITSDSKTQTVQNSTYDMHDMHTANENENGFSLSVPDSNNINNKSNSEYAVVIKNKQIIGNDTNQQQSHD